MQQFMPEDLSREHRQMLVEEAAHEKLVRTARATKRENQLQFNVNPFRVWRLMLVQVKEWLQRRSQFTVKSKPVTVGR